MKMKINTTTGDDVGQMIEALAEASMKPSTTIANRQYQVKDCYVYITTNNHNTHKKLQQ